MRPLDWHGMWALQTHPLEICLRAAIIFLFVQLVFRLTGRKELARLSTNDVALLFLVTIATRQTIVGDDRSLTAAMIGLGTLAALAWLVSWISWRNPRFADFVKGPVRTLIRDGRVNEAMLRHTRLSRADLEAQLRSYGRTRLDEVRDAYEERSGRVTFVFWNPGGKATDPPLEGSPD